jgi:hypothetical protein
MRTIGTSTPVIAFVLMASAGVSTQTFPGQSTGAAPMRLKGHVASEGGGPIAAARLKTDALRGPMGAQFEGQRIFTTRTGKNGDWSLLGPTRGLWLFEITAPNYLPHVVVVPIAWMLPPEPTPWETHFSLLPRERVAPGGGEPGSAAARLVEVADLIEAGKGKDARDTLARLVEIPLDAAALCAAGNLALLIREPAIGRKFFDLAAAAAPKWPRPQLGIASASMMLFDFDRAIKAYGFARSENGDKRFERMLSGAIRELQQIQIIGK